MVHAPALCPKSSPFVSYGIGAPLHLRSSVPIWLCGDLCRCHRLTPGPGIEPPYVPIPIKKVPWVGYPDEPAASGRCPVDASNQGLRPVPGAAETESRRLYRVKLYRVIHRLLTRDRAYRAAYWRLAKTC